MNDMDAGKKTFVDLGKYSVKTPLRTDVSIKVVEVRRGADLKPISDMVYRGNVVVLDFSHFEEGDQEKRAMAKYLMKTAADISGHFSEASDTLMVIGGNGMPIERCRIRHGA